MRRYEKNSNQLHLESNAQREAVSDLKPLFHADIHDEEGLSDLLVPKSSGHVG